MEKIWKKVPSHDLYMVSNYGEVMNVKRNKLLTPRKSDRGYLSVLLYYSCGKKYKSYRIHRLVLSCFDNVDYTTHKLECNHNDDNKENNRLDNLCWVTRKENMNWNGLQQRIKRTGPKDIESFKIKMQEIQEKSPVIGTSIINGDVIYFRSLADARRSGFSSGNICSCCYGKRKKHKGYTWNFFNN